MDEQLIPIYVMGKHYDVPEGLTILTAMEWIGYKFIRGCGCRDGFCGACGTAYKIVGEQKLKFGLACETLVEPNMYLVQIPFYPNPKKIYDINEIKDPAEALLRLFPEIKKCVGCGACAKACPNELRPIDFVAAALRGDWIAAAEMSFDCVMCGLCASRCTGELGPQNIALFVRRYYCKYIRPMPEGLIRRIKDIKDNKYESILQKLVTMDEAQLKKLYDQREFEKIDV
ncbi:MAG: 4Fe-4S dicluster domain-containing protein [Sporomusaceae bacterium]|nr:4Fe-4S dicluster domain-containing protein [Sporomusaceae bacterium]